MNRALISTVVRNADKSSQMWNQHQLLPTAKRYLMRSNFYVKRSKLTDPESWFRKVPCDSFILDLEDAVPKEDKDNARMQVAHLLRNLPTTAVAPNLLVRVNDVGGSERAWEKDIATVMNDRLMGFILSKTESSSDVKDVSEYLSYMEKKRGFNQGHFKLIPLLESANAVQDAEAIAGASGRTVAMILGRYDFMANTSCTIDSMLMRHASEMVVLAARARGIMPLLSAYCELDNHNYYENECDKAFQMGFAGRSTLTIDQVVVANRAFSVVKDVAEKAAATLAPKSSGVSVRSAGSSRSMEGPPHQKLARNLLEQVVMQEEKLRHYHSGVATTDIVSSRRPDKTVSTVLSCNRVITSPHEITVTDGWHSCWDQQFFPCSKLQTSNHFARQLNFDDSLVPFSLLLNLSMSLSVASFSLNAKVHLDTVGAVQLEPVYDGTTLANLVHPLSMIRKNNCEIVTSEHLLIRMSDKKPVFRSIKKTMFPIGTFQLDGQLTGESLFSEIGSYKDVVIKNYLSSSTEVKTTRVLRQQHVQPGQLYVHDLVKSFGPDDAISLSYMLKGTNMLHINNQLPHEKLLMSGPCVVAATVANQGLDFGDVLYEEWENFLSINKTNNNDMISTASFVLSVESCPECSDLEYVNLRTLGFRNVDPDKLEQIQFPGRLFEMNGKPKDYEKFCLEHVTELTHRILTIGSRKILRAKPL